MRIALISDIHGHYTALEAVLADIAGQPPVDAILCLGDVATLGPQPRQVLDTLNQLGCPCVRGNHEAALLEPERATEYHIAPVLQPTLHWCIAQLTPDDTEYLRSFSPIIEKPLGPDTTLLCFHGSPRSTVDVILATTPPEQIDTLFAGQTATVWAGGHSHIQMLRQHTGRLLINPGSVGNAFRLPFVPGTIPTLLPWAEYGIVTEAQGTLSVELRRVPFDMAAFAQALSASDLPIKDWWLEQYGFTENGG